MENNGCSKCALNFSKQVPYRGNKNADIVFIAESPGKVEVEQGQMLIGPSGKLFTKELNRVGIDIGSCFLMNAARCMIPKEEMSAGQINSILDCCKGYVDLALHTIEPKIICAMGAIATQQVYKKMTIKHARNQFIWLDKYNCWLLVTFHPAACLRSPTNLPFFQKDFESLAEFVKNGYKQTKEITWKEVQSIRPILDGDCHQEKGYYLTGIDTETQGVLWHDPNSITISYQVSKSLTEGWTVILHEEVEKDRGDFNIFIQRGGTKSKPEYVEIGVKRAENYEQKIEELKELCSRPDFRLFFANIKYEKHRFKNLGVEEMSNFAMCVFVGAHCLDSYIFRSVDLDTLINYFGKGSSHKGMVSDAEKEDMLKLLSNDRDKFVKYASLDPCETLQVALKIREKLLQDRDTLKYFVNFALPAERDFLFEIERNGVTVDLDALPKVKKQIKEEMEECVLEIRNLCPSKVVERHSHSFKLTRSIILKEALFEWTDGKLRKNQTEPEHHNYGFCIEPPAISKKSKEPSTDKKEALKTILEGKYPKKAKELVEKYIHWSELSKLLTVYIKNIEKYTTKEGTLHASFSTTGTSSGRVASRNPNLMNIPARGKLAKYVKQLFIASPGRNLVQGDFKASEIKFVAQRSKDKNLVKVLNEGKDIHLVTGLAINDLPENHQFQSTEERDLLRHRAKSLNFGALYLISVNGFKRHADQGYGVKLSYKQAEKNLNKFFALYPGIKKWHNEGERLLREQGYLRSMFGRIRYAHNLNSNDEGVAKAEIRTLINFEIQNPSSDNAVLAGMNILADPEIDTANDVKIILFLHDALYFSIRTKVLTENLKKIKHHMENTGVKEVFGVDMIVPMDVDLEVGERLSEMHELECI